MPGYRADPDAIGAAAGELCETVDSVATARDHLDAEVCAGIGPGRLAAVAAGLTAAARRDLDEVVRTIGDSAELAVAAARGYAKDDETAAGLFRRQEPT